jgi:hypothetical protein
MMKKNNYCWVVLCKNRWFHFRRSFFKGHQIPLGQTDSAESLPLVDDSFPVPCSDCGKEYVYKASEVRKSKYKVPASFTPHPLFHLGKDRRRSRRWLQDVRLIVRGESRENVPFQEKTYATSVSTHGALMILSTIVTEGQMLSLINPRTQDEIEGRVVRFGPPYRGLTQVGVEFVRPAQEFWPADVSNRNKMEEYSKVGP